MTWLQPEPVFFTGTVREHRLQDDPDEPLKRIRTPREAAMAKKRYRKNLEKVRRQARERYKRHKVKRQAAARERYRLKKAA